MSDLRGGREAQEASRQASAAPRRAGVRLRRGTVMAIRAERPGAIELEVEVEGDRAPAIAYPELTGPIGTGDAVLLNTTALALGLGTGGFHLVVAVEWERPTDLGHAGRVVKARYTPLQTAVEAVEESHRDALEGSAGLAGTPVVCAPLHSMVAAIAAGAKAGGAARVVYVMTDGAALPGAVSRLVPRLRESGLVDTWITCGQAFGGELEAVTLWTGLLAAVVVASADVVIVADGPGNLGTDTTLGVSALASGHALNATEMLGGNPIAALRISFADERERHRGLSHHSVTILDRICVARAHVAVPVLDDPQQRDSVWSVLRSRGLEQRHRLVESDGTPAVDELGRRGVAVDSMGRSPADDPAFFLAAGAAGVLAARSARAPGASSRSATGDPAG